MPTLTALRVGLGAALAAVAACTGDDLPGPSPRGELVVTIRSEGAGSDPDGYLLTLDSHQPRPIATAGSFRLTGLAPGAHRLRFGGIASNCTLEGGAERVVEIVATQTTEVELHIACGPPTGRVELTIIDPGSTHTSYAASLDGSAPMPVRPGEKLTFSAVEDGLHRVEVTGFAPLCVAAGGARREVAVHGDAVVLNFDVVCLASLGGRLLITTSSNESDPGHLLSIRADGSAAVDLGAAGPGGLGKWSPDGRTIVFQSCRDGVSNLGLCKIYLTNSEGSQSKRLSDADGIEPAWSPDGTRVVFSGNVGLFVVNADGSNLTQLTSGRDRSPAWSPDGSAIAFSRLIDFSQDRCAIIRLDPACPTDIMTVAPDGSNVRPITRNQPLADDYDPAWSHDGTIIAYLHYSRGQRTRLLTRRLGAAASDTVRIDADVIVGSPVWSPDGRSIAFGAGRADGTTDVAIVPAEGGTPVLIERPGGQSPSDWR
jgi:hypothetical protein